MCAQHLSHSVTGLCTPVVAPPVPVCLPGAPPTGGTHLESNEQKESEKREKREGEESERRAKGEEKKSVKRAKREGKQGERRAEGE